MRLDFEHSCCGARNGRDPHKSPESCANAQPVGSWCGSWTARCSAPRSESTGTPFEPMFDRFAIGLRVRMLVRLRDALALGTRLTRASLRRMRGLGFLRGLRGLCLI